jgi:hypothetical protein
MPGYKSLNDAVFDEQVTLRAAYLIMRQFLNDYLERGDTPVSDSPTLPSCETVRPPTPPQSTTSSRPPELCWNAPVKTTSQLANKPLERAGMKARRPSERASAGRSAPSR